MLQNKIAHFLFTSIRCINEPVVIFLIALTSFTYGCAGSGIMGRGIPIPVFGGYDYEIESEPPIEVLGSNL